MTDDRQTPAGLEAFAAMIDAYGGQMERWPAGAKDRFAPLIAREPRASRLLAEARALDEVLACAPAVSAARMTALANDIRAAAGYWAAVSATGQQCRH